MALASLIKQSKLTTSKDEFYVPLCDILMDLVEKDINGPDATALTQIAHSLAHDFLNLATLAGRLLWYEGITPDENRSPDLVAISVDTETYLVSLKTACDILAEAFAYFCVEPNKRGQVPRTFRKLVLRARNNPDSLRETFRFITEHFDWFMELRSYRDQIVHQGYDLVTYTERDFLQFFFAPLGVPELQQLHGGYKQEDFEEGKPKFPRRPLLTFLRTFTLSVFGFADQLAQAIEQQLELQRSKTHVLSGVYIPALHHLMSYVEPAKSYERDAMAKRRGLVTAWYLQRAGDYLNSANRGYPDGFWWQFAMHLSAMFDKPPTYVSRPSFGNCGVLLEWNLVFVTGDLNLAVSLRDNVSNKEDWLKIVKNNLDEFARAANVHRAILVANTIVLDSESSNIAESQDFLVIETDPIIGAKNVFARLTRQDKEAGR